MCEAEDDIKLYCENVLLKKASSFHIPFIKLVSVILEEKSICISFYSKSPQTYEVS